MLKLIFVALKLRLRRVRKKGKKEKKMKNCVLQKKTFLFLHVNELDIVNSSGGQCGSKKSCGEVVLAKNFF